MTRKRKPGGVSFEPHVPVIPEGAEVTVVEYFTCAHGHTHQLDGSSGELAEKMADGTMRRKCPQITYAPWTNTELFRYAAPLGPETAAGLHRSLEAGDAGGLRRHGDGQKNLLAKLLRL